MGERMLAPVLVWDDLRIFLAVHRTRSHAAAARELQVASTTVGRRLAALEEAIGARLFARTPDGLAPTAAAVSLLPRAERMEAEAIEADRALTGVDTRVSGVVRIACGDGFASYVLAPALSAFLAQHPGLTLEVRSGVRAVDLTRAEVDVSIRNIRPRERSLVARRLGLETQRLYASSAYLAARGHPRTVADLAGHDLVLWERDLDRRAAGQAWLLDLAPRARIAVRVSNTLAMMAACAEGAGIGLLSSAFTRSDPRFERVLPRLEPPLLELWSVAHADLRSSARVNVTRTWLEGLARGLAGV